jgi:hypothetical protein
VPPIAASSPSTGQGSSAWRSSSSISPKRIEPWRGTRSVPLPILRFVDARRLPDRADEQAGEKAAQRRMILPAADPRAEQVGPAQERPVRWRDPKRVEAGIAGRGIPLAAYRRVEFGSGILDRADDLETVLDAGGRRHEHAQMTIARSTVSAVRTLPPCRKAPRRWGSGGSRSAVKFCWVQRLFRRLHARLRADQVTDLLLQMTV